jgi:hypothetical protein
MSVKSCNFDKNPAAYVCTIHNEYYCLEHYAQHVSDGLFHISFKISNSLPQESFEQLQEEIRNRIKVLEEAKIQLVIKAAQIIADIRKQCISSIQHIDSQLQFYISYIRNNNFDDQTLQKAREMLQTRLTLDINDKLQIKLIENPINENAIRKIDIPPISEIKYQPIRLTKAELTNQNIKETKIQSEDLGENIIPNFSDLSLFDKSNSEINYELINIETKSELKDNIKEDSKIKDTLDIGIFEKSIRISSN